MGLAHIVSPALLLSLLVAAVIAIPIVSQNATDVPKWEAVSIKPCQVFGGRGGGASLSPGRAIWNCQLVGGLIQAAYLINANGQTTNLGAVLSTVLTGGPSWIRSDAYTINAKPVPGEF